MFIITFFIYDFLLFMIAKILVDYFVTSFRSETFMILMFYSWSGKHVSWSEPFRLCHVTTGRYLGLTEEKGLHLVDRDKADINTTSFCFRSSKVRNVGRNIPNFIT